MSSATTPSKSTPSKDKRPPAPPPDSKCRAYEIGHAECDGHVVGSSERRLESVAAMNCCADCCENSFRCQSKYVLSTAARDPAHQQLAQDLIKKLAKGCARQGCVWRNLDREGFATGKGYQLLYPHGGRPPAVALVTECPPEDISLEPRTWPGRSLTSLLAPIDDAYIREPEEEGGESSTAAATAAAPAYTRLYTAQQTFCILKKDQKAPGPQVKSAAKPEKTPKPAAGSSSPQAKSPVALVVTPSGHEHNPVDNVLGPAKKKFKAA